MCGIYSLFIQVFFKTRILLNMCIVWYCPRFRGHGEWAEPFARLCGGLSFNNALSLFGAVSRGLCTKVSVCYTGAGLWSFSEFHLFIYHYQCTVYLSYIQITITHETMYAYAYVWNKTVLAIYFHFAIVSQFQYFRDIFSYSAEYSICHTIYTRTKRGKGTYSMKDIKTLFDSTKLSTHLKKNVKVDGN